MAILSHVATKLLPALLLLQMIAMNSSAAEIKGVPFAETVQVHNVTLSLHGLAILKWAMLFDVYAGGFYLPDAVAGSDWDEDVPKKLELAYFREIAANAFAESSDQLLRETLTPTEYLNLSARLQTFYTFFQDVKPGDRYSINYLPGRGTELRLNGEILGQVPGHDFAVAYFGLWLGPQPISAAFRDKLLEGV